MGKETVFDGEFIDGTTGDTRELIAITVDRARAMIVRMKDGDTIVLNAKVKDWED